MIQSSLLDKLLLGEPLTSEEKQECIQALEDDPDLAQSLAGWRHVCEHLRNQILDSQDMVLYSLVAGGCAEDLNESEAEEISEKWRSLDPVVESHPGFMEAAAQIEQDRQSFISCWEDAKYLPVIWWRPFRVAAAITAVCVLVAIVLFGQREPVQQTTTISTGEYERIELPDGSIAHLTGPATLQFNGEKFERTVELAGRAFFDITSRPNQFTVQTDEALAHVLGTRFGISSLNGVTQVVLESGRIKVSSKGPLPESVYLSPGQMTSVTNRHPSSAEHVNLTDALRWTGFLFFRKTSLKQAAMLLSSSRNVRVEVDPLLMHEKVTGTFAPDIPVEDILSALAQALNAEILVEGKTFRIVP